MSNADIIIVLIACGTALFIDVLLLMDSYSTITNSVIEIKKVKNVVFTGVIQANAYFVEYVLSRYHYYGMEELGMLVESMVYFSNSLYVLAYADFVYSKYRRNLYSIKRNRIMFLIPIYAVMVLAFVNIFCPVYSRLEPGTLVHQETPWAKLVSLTAIAYILFTAVCDVRELKKNLRYNNFPVSLYFIPTLIGIILEALYSEIPTVPICCSMSIMVTYMRILKQIGYIDSLSGVFTKSHMSIYINSLLGKPSPTTMLAGIMLDVNCFKEINDTYGHITGDRAIQIIGDILKDATKKNGLCFRYGGDEFVIILRVTNTNQITALMDRLNGAIEEFNARKAQVFQLSLSQGYAIYDTEKDSVVSFVERMDAEMYKNKRLCH